MKATSPLESCRSLPQTADLEWIVDRRTESGSDPLWLWVAAGREEFRGFTVGQPSEEDFQELLASVFESPTEGEAGRPSRIVVAESDLATGLESLLAPLNIAVAQRAFSAPETELLDSYRPAVMQQLMLNAAMPEEHDPEQFERLLDAVDALSELDPWPQLPKHTCFMIEGFGDEPVAVLTGFEGGVRALGVLTLKDLETASEPNPKAFDREGIWLQFEEDTIMGHERTWAHMGQANDEPLATGDQVNALLAAMEVVFKSMHSGKRPPEEQSFTLEDWVDMPCTIGVLFLGEESSGGNRRRHAGNQRSRPPARKGKGHHRH